MRFVIKESGGVNAEVFNEFLAADTALTDQTAACASAHQPAALVRDRGSIGRSRQQCRSSVRRVVPHAELRCPALEWLSMRLRSFPSRRYNIAVSTERRRASLALSGLNQAAWGVTISRSPTIGSARLR